MSLQSRVVPHRMITEAILQPFLFTCITPKPFSWSYASTHINGGDFRVLKMRDPIYTVFLLGLLDAEKRHFRRYVELYTERGVNAVTFVVRLRSLIGYDLGKRVESKVLELMQEIVKWVLESENDGKDRLLLFHTFSKTGWLMIEKTYWRSLKGVLLIQEETQK